MRQTPATRKSAPPTAHRRATRGASYRDANLELPDFDDLNALWADEDENDLERLVTYRRTKRE